MSAPRGLMTIERVAVLQRVALFREVPGHTLVAVARLLEEVSFEAGDRIIDRGSVEDGLFRLWSWGRQTPAVRWTTSPS